MLLILAASSLAATAACAPRVATLGNTPRDDQLAKIRPGQTMAQVRETLGSPSSVAMFDKNIWYYIGKREEQWAFFEPRVKKQNVLIVKFDEAGTVSDIRRLGLKDAQKVAYVDSETPTLGREDGIITAMMRILLDQRGILGGGTTNPDEFR